ncbi:TolC family protein [Parasediminibacterium sp. JCM 36343]|uniref:TolC family protein n=1 Tax=Parasediminibacterium sp. JCM 36343 TaxID=3374279 RepID=UPI00397D71AC
MQGCFKQIFLGLVVLSFSVCANAQESIYTEINYKLLQKLIDEAKINYPKMKSFERRVIMAQDNVTKTKKSWYDLLTFSLAYSPTNTTSLSAPVLSGYQVGVFLNLAAILQKPYTIRQSKNELLIANLDKDAYDLNIEAEVKSRYYKYIQQLTILKLQSKTAVDIEANYKIIKYKFEKGEETFENYNKAIIAFTEQKQNIIASEGNLLVSKSTLEEIICKKLEDVR